MPRISSTSRIPRLPAAIALCLALSALCSLSVPALASASTTQIAMFEDGQELTSPQAAQTTLLRLRELGATTVREFIAWAKITRNPLSTKAPSNFNAADPNAYPDANWAALDAIVRDAKQYGMTLDFTLAGGAPVWAEGSGIPSSGAKNLNYAWKPNAGEYGQFVRAVGERYDGSFSPHGVGPALPAVRFWALWNEPNFGEDLGPQAIDGSSLSVAPNMYRGLLNAGWSALQATGHGHDTILIGEYAARGIGPAPPGRGAPQGYPGNYGQTKPLIFIRTLYCLDSSYRQLRGSTASGEGCPTNAAGSRRFRSQNPALFNAGGVGDHPYGGNLSPVTDGVSDPNFAAFADLGNLAGVLDRTQRVYGSAKKFPIYNDEYGYITDPPNRGPVQGGGHYVSPATAAYYINWAEYLSYRNPRIKSYMQFLLTDPPILKKQGLFASGLLTASGAQKPTYSAYRLPLYLPVTTFKRSQNVEVWGGARPAGFISSDTHTAQQAQIQLQSGSRGAFKTINTVRISSREGYFDIHMKFPSSGTVRLIWTYPQTDPLLPASAPGATVYSRHVAITVH
jgi:hypothetical protein